MSTFAIADIHGRLDELGHLLSVIAQAGATEYVFLGDYIDRGKKSKGVISKLISLQESDLNCHFLKGNHEVMALNALRDNEASVFWEYCGGDATLKSYGGAMDDSHLQFLSELKLYHETHEAIFVHGSLNPKTAMSCQTEEDLLWQKCFSPLNHVSGKRIYCGHTTQVLGVPSLQGHARCIDCAGWLTAINTSNDTVYQVNDEGITRSFAMDMPAE